MNKFFSLFIKALFLSFFLVLSACSSDGDSSSDRDKDAEASYRVTYTGLWSQADFPTNFPGGSAHFTRLVGGTHNEQVVFWESAQPATQGIERMAESGSTGDLVSEVEAAKQDGKAEFVLLGSGNIDATETSSFEFDINQSFPLVTLTTMVAPSPDWFVGVHGLSLFDETMSGWKQTVVVNLKVYDAGTESGVGFSLSNPAESGVIALLTSDLIDTDFTNGVGSGGKFIATMTFERIK